MTRLAKKLTDIEIDEISVVDRPANQHGLITFAKNAGAGEGIPIQEDQMPDAEIYDADGTPVDPEELEIGDVVYDEDGNEYVFLEEEEEPEPVGKAGGWGAFKEGATAAWKGARNTPGARAAIAGDAASTGQKRGAAFGLHLGNKKNLARYGAGIGAGAAGTAYALGKSAGDEILEALSKAVTDSDRDQIIAKAISEVNIYKAQADELSKALDEERDARITEAYISKAAEYNLPVAPGILGPILKAMAEVLSDEQLDVVDQLFSSVGDALYDEIGYVGGTDQPTVLDNVWGATGELVAKSNMSEAEAMTALFSANPAAYEAYLAEGR